MNGSYYRFCRNILLNFRAEPFNIMCRYCDSHSRSIIANHLGTTVTISWSHLTFLGNQHENVNGGKRSLGNDHNDQMQLTKKE